MTAHPKVNPPPVPTHSTELASGRDRRRREYALGAARKQKTQTNIPWRRRARDERSRAPPTRLTELRATRTKDTRFVSRFPSRPRTDDLPPGHRAVVDLPARFLGELHRVGMRHVEKRQRVGLSGGRFLGRGDGGCVHASRREDGHGESAAEKGERRESARDRARERARRLCVRSLGEPRKWRSVKVVFTSTRALNERVFRISRRWHHATRVSTAVSRAPQRVRGARRRATWRPSLRGGTARRRARRLVS
jgi:hypothetical protein